MFNILRKYKPDGLLFTGSVDRTIRLNPSGTNKSSYVYKLTPMAALSVHYLTMKDAPKLWK